MQKEKNNTFFWQNTSRPQLSIPQQSACGQPGLSQQAPTYADVLTVFPGHSCFLWAVQNGSVQQDRPPAPPVQLGPLLPPWIHLQFHGTKPEFKCLLHIPFFLSVRQIFSYFSLVPGPYLRCFSSLSLLCSFPFSHSLLPFGHYYLPFLSPDGCC